MTAQLELETYRRLVSYLGDQISLAEFRRWFDGNTWDQAQWESPLIGQIELAFAELSSCKLSEHEFAEALRTSIPTVTLELQPMTASDLQTLVTSAANNTTKPMSAFVVGNHVRPAEAPCNNPVIQPLWQVMSFGSSY